MRVCVMSNTVMVKMTTWIGYYPSAPPQFNKPSIPSNPTLPHSHPLLTSPLLSPPNMPTMPSHRPHKALNPRALSPAMPHTEIGPLSPLPG